MPGRKSKSTIQEFEKRFNELEHIVTRMEQGEQSLDQSLSDFETGMLLCRSLREALAEAEQRIQILADQNKDANLEPFESVEPTEPESE